jgi:zinc D-Ala-D-Ala carboxypeptidase
LRKPAIDLSLALLLAAIAALASTWPDSVRVGEQVYAVPLQWRGLRQGPADAPQPEDLVALPDSLCLEGLALYLRRPAAVALVTLAEAARRDGIRILANSAYRSVETQRGLIQKRLDAGRVFKEITWGVAPPGYSEHMLGTTVDLTLGGAYKINPAYIWLSKHAWEFGFVETYPEDPTRRFPWEPWHWAWQEPARSPEISGEDVHGP